MIKPLTLFLCLGLSVAGCSRLGSLGSIGSLGGGTGAGTAPRTRAQLPDLVPDGARLVSSDKRVLAAAITSAELTPTPNGAILRVQGRPRAGGAFNVALVPQGRQGGTLLYDLKMQLSSAQNTGPRQISAALALSRADLAGVRSIRVRAANGTRTLRR